jgi:diguanylate cyclase (GGDEF)-like protein/PAS domain S-box-containing protein
MGLLAHFAGVVQSTAPDRRSEGVMASREVRGAVGALSPSDVLDALSGAVVVADNDGQIVDWNASSTELYGWSRDEAIGQGMDDLLDPVIPASRVEGLHERLRNHERWEGEFTVRHRDGRRVPVHAWVTGIYDDDGAVVGTVGIASDLRRRATSVTPEATEEWLQRVIRATQGGLMLFDASGTITYANDAVAEILGTTPDGLRGRSSLDFIPPDDRPALQARWAAEANGGRSMQRETRVNRADGTPIWVEIISDPLLDDDGVFIGVVARIAHLEERQQAFAELQDREERFQRLFLESPIGMGIVGMDLRIQQTNPALARMLGYEPGEVVGRTVDELTSPSDRDEAAEYAFRVKAGEPAPSTRTKHFRHKDGHDVLCRVTNAVVRNESGIPQYAVGLIEDLTDQEQALQLIQDQQERLQMILDASGMAAWEVDIDTGRYVNSENLAKVFGTSDDGPLEFDDFLSRVHPDDLQRFLDSPLTGGTNGLNGRFVVDYRLRQDDGGTARLRSQGSFVVNDDGRPVAVRGTTVDVTEQYEAEQDRLEQAQVYRRMIDAARDAFVGVDHDGLIVEWNRAAEAMFGWPAPDAMGRKLVGTAISPADRAAVDIGLVDGDGEPTDGTIPGRVAMTGLHRNGREFPIEASFIHLPEGGGATRFRAFIRDITDQVAYEKQLEDQALTDSLTGLPNRALFVDRLREAVARLQRRKAGLAVLFIDVDSFKVVNDSLGHAVGDELLVALAHRLGEHLRPGDTLARFGGDEFVVLCENLADQTAAGELAQRLLNALDAPLLLGERRHHVAVSIGIAPVDDPLVHPEEVIRNADTAMYRAKERGGGQSEIFDDAIRTRALARLNLENDLRSAVENDEFVVHYQPLLTMDERVVGAEALVRWNHPTRGLLAPGEFIPAAEQTRLIRPLGLQVLTRALGQLATWHREGAGYLQMSVNLAGAQVDELDLPHKVDRLLKLHDLDPASLCLEITESMFMEDSVAVGDGLQALRKLGVRLAVDDFGTGYSSMQYLRRFPLHTLKLDRVFVDGLDRNPADRAIVGSMIDLAHALGLTAVAEGVERAGQLQALQDLGCDLAQGFYWSPPVPAETFATVLEAHPAVAAPTS